MKNEIGSDWAKIWKWVAPKPTTAFQREGSSAESYLYVDCFDPHEPWEAPHNYFRLYGDPNYDGRRFVSFRYGPAARFGYTDAEIAHVHANYCGLVTLVDTWFGKLMKKLDTLGLAQNTAVFFLSDHGTNFADNPRRVVGKPPDAMYPATAQNPLLIRLPSLSRAGQPRSELVYTNLDVAATVYELAAIQSAQGVHGQSLLPLLSGNGRWEPREYVTCRYAHSLCYVDDEHWVLTDIDGAPQEIFDLRDDPHCQNDIKDQLPKDVFVRAWKRLLHDAGGAFPDYREKQETDAIGQKVK